MPSEQDRIADNISIVQLILAGILLVVGFFLSILIATAPIGLPMMAAGGIWAAVLYGSASYRAKHQHHS